MKEIRETQKKYCSLAMLLAIFIGISFFLLGLKPAGKGFIIGTLFSIFNFILMGETLPAKITKSRAKATVLSFFSIWVRYGLLAIPIVISIKLEQFNLAATTCGLFMIQFVILADAVIRTLYFSTRKNKITDRILWKI